MKLNCYDEVKALTQELVGIDSVVSMPEGESAVARYIRDYYQALSYFQAHPRQTGIFQTKNDGVERHCALTWIRGTKDGGGDETVVLIGHIDTVGVEEFGPIRDYAFRPAELPQKLKEYFSLSPQVLADLESGEYMFGRGALDMKSGVAAHMVMMKYFSQHPEELRGNLVHVAECDEEDNSHGILTALEELLALREKEGFRYIACINSDYSTAEEEGDDSRCLYFGSVGKLLPGFMAFGKEAHVGAAFQAFDPNLLIAEVTRELSLNADLCDQALGEVTLPPISLKQTDTKERYTVQTAICAYSYYNYFTHSQSPAQVLETCRRAGERAFRRVIDGLEGNYARYCEKVGRRAQRLPWQVRVVTWKELWAQAEQAHGEAFRRAMRDFYAAKEAEEPAPDLRVICADAVQEVWKWIGDKSPTLVVFFSSLYYGRIQTDETDPRQKRLVDAVQAAVERIAPEAQRRLRTRMFYPYISDMSFLAVSDSPEALAAAREQLPAGDRPDLPDMERIRQLNLPVVNIGSYGFDGHMLTERVDMLHTFRNVPNLTYETVRQLIG